MSREEHQRGIKHEILRLSWKKSNVPTGTAEHLLMFCITTTPERIYISILGELQVTQSAGRMFPENTDTRWLQSREEAERSRREERPEAQQDVCNEIWFLLLLTIQKGQRAIPRLPLCLIQRVILLKKTQSKKSGDGADETKHHVSQKEFPWRVGRPPASSFFDPIHITQTEVQRSCFICDSFQCVFVPLASELWWENNKRTKQRNVTWKSASASSLPSNVMCY